jgi:S1-C subfamily serine protease
MEIGPVIALQHPGQLRNLARFMLVLALAVLMATVAHAVASDLSDTFERVNPAVVEIRTVSSSSFQQHDGTTATSELGLGSGVLIASDQVLTASHLVETANRIQVRLLDGTMRQARVTSSEQFADVSLLTLDAPVPGIEPITLGDSDRTRIGERVFVVGAPYGISHTLTVGYVSALHQNDPSDGFSYTNLIQTDAAINAGNSGGPLFNEHGELIGIVSHILSRSGGSEGLGFAVAINSVREFVIDHRSFWPGFVGVLLPPRLARALNVPQASGMLIQQVAEESPAQIMGLRESEILIEVDGRPLRIGGDIVLAANGIRIVSPEAVLQIRDAIRHLPSDGKLTIEIWRQGRRETIEFVPAQGGQSLQSDSDTQ